MNFGFQDNYVKNNFNVNTATLNENLIQAVRVISIILDETHPRFNELGGWNALGTIEYELVNSPYSRPLSKDFKFPTASPLNPSTKNFPLINETTYIISLPNTKIGNTNVSQKYYYINIIGLWNHPHHNAYPANPNNPPPEQNKDYLQTSIGNVRRVTDQSTEIFLGKTFKERPNVHPLLPFEGDVIQEGRWGNSIRLGSTVKNTPNEWSSTGNDGDPIVVIRNGQGTQTEEGWIPIIEQINNDESLIYLTSTQTIPLKATSTNYTSYENTPPTSPDKYSGTQLILNSGRLMFNSYNDHILFSSAKSINLNSNQSVNVDAKKLIVQADNIYLGIESLATEPLLLGNTTVDLLKNLIGALNDLATTLKTAQTTPTVPSTPANLTSINLAAVSLSTKLEVLNKQLNTLTSKRNFTL
jgi:hypothetical protein